jgi:hypothetical protein
MCPELVSENQTVRKMKMLDQDTENALIKLAQKIDMKHEVERNKLEQENRNKPNAEYLRVMGLAL